jgi:hypothetical protein
VSALGATTPGIYGTIKPIGISKRLSGSKKLRREEKMAINPDDLRKYFSGRSERTYGIVRRLNNLPSLTPEVLYEIAHWKLRDQYGRDEHNLVAISPGALKVITSTVFNYPPVTQPLFEFRVKKLKELPGIGIGMASAILALRFPEHACVVDFRGWRQLYGVKPKNLGIAEYWRYLKDVRIIGKELGWDPLDVDIAIWEKDRFENPYDSSCY